MKGRALLLQPHEQAVGPEQLDDGPFLDRIDSACGAPSKLFLLQGDQCLLDTGNIGLDIFQGVPASSRAFLYLSMVADSNGA